MKITFPNIKQEEFDYAFECLDDCKRPDAADFGFNYPYFTPGGQYGNGNQWWQLDSSLALSGYKWADRSFCETSLLNFIKSQKEDGRICLYGRDKLPEQVAGNNFPKQSEGVSSLPKIFDVAYHILKGTDNEKLILDTYSMLKKYLDWWYRDRYDDKTGLISSVFEETFIPYLGNSLEYAAVDTNVEVYVGLTYTAEIAKKLNYMEDARLFELKAEKLKLAINTYLWNEENGAYYPYDLNKSEQVDCLMASTFYPLRMNIASSNQKDRLIALLKDDSHFNWNTIPLTSVSKKDPIFTTTRGIYQGNASWSGNVWTLINEMVVRGLIDCGENELASELALKTVYAFNNKCSEFINPFDSTPHGVEKYAWSASQYLELIIEVVFGVSADFAQKEVRINPHLTDGLKNEKLSLTGIWVFKDVYLDLFIENGKICYNISNENIVVKTKY